MDDVVTAEELLSAWRDAMRAAVLAERLAVVATDAGREDDTWTGVLVEVAETADRAADAATSAASRARAAATRAGDLADAFHGDGQQPPRRDGA